MRVSKPPGNATIETKKMPARLPNLTTATWRKSSRRWKKKCLKPLASYSSKKPPLFATKSKPCRAVNTAAVKAARPRANLSKNESLKPSTTRAGCLGKGSALVRNSLLPAIEGSLFRSVDRQNIQLQADRIGVANGATLTAYFIAKCSRGLP